MCLLVYPFVFFNLSVELVFCKFFLTVWIFIIPEFFHNIAVYFAFARPWAFTFRLFACFLVNPTVFFNIGVQFVFGNFPKFACLFITQVVLCNIAVHLTFARKWFFTFLPFACTFVNPSILSNISVQPVVVRRASCIYYHHITAKYQRDVLTLI